MDKPGKKIKRNMGSGEVDRVLRRNKPAEKEQPPSKALPALELPPGPDNNAVSVEEEGSIDFKGQLTEKESRFLEAYLSGECSIDQAMVAAGYGNYHMRSRYRRARKIIQKYETQAGARKVLRACGVGEVRVAKKIDQLMEGESERTQLGAIELAAKCLGMTQEQKGPTQGIQIIIHTSLPPAPGEPGPGPPVLDVQEKKALPPQKKPLQITK
jgi:hypothetical protein